MYDMVSGKQLLKKSYFVSKSKALEQFPMLKEDMLCGAIIYYDGMCVCAVLGVAIEGQLLLISHMQPGHVACTRVTAVSLQGSTMTPE